MKLTELDQEQLDTIIEECEENRKRIAQMESFIRLMYELAQNKELGSLRASSMKPEIEKLGIKLEY